MTTFKWSTPAAATTISTLELDSLAADSESTAMTLDNSSSRDLYGLFRLQLGSFNPLDSGSSVLIKIYGPNGQIGSSPLQSSGVEVTGPAEAKDLECIMQVPPFANRVTVTNLCGEVFAATGNSLSVQLFSESDT